MSGRDSQFLARRLVLLGGILAGLVGVRASGQANGKITGTGGRCGPFALLDQHGRTVTDRALCGHYALIYFGYTRCMDFCPATLAKLARVLRLLAGTGVNPKVVFISVDPAHDTPAITGAYARQFSPAILALTGTPAAIDHVVEAYNVFVGVGDMDTGGIKHTSMTFLIGPDGKFVRMFSQNQPAETIARALLALPRKA